MSRFSPNGTRFDIAYVLLFSGDDGIYNNREGRVLREFSRVGIDVEPFRHVRTAYDSVIERSINHTGLCSGGFMNSTIGHLRMIKSAYNRGAASAIFFEDDVRFLKDVALCRTIESELPSDFGLALFDWVLPLGFTDPATISRDMSNKATEHWIRFDGLRNASAYAMSRDTMKAMIDIIESPCHDKSTLRLIDQLYRYMIHRYGLNGYAAVPNVCTQCEVSGHTSYESMWGRYELAGVERKNYSEL